MTTVVSNQYWLVVVILLILLRIYLLGKRTLLVVTIMLGILGAGYAHYCKHRLQTQQLTQAIIVRERLVEVTGDQCRITGNRLTFIGRDLVTMQPVSGIAYLTDQHQARCFDQPTKNIRINIDGQLQPLMPPTNENQYDFRVHYYHQGISNQLIVKRINNITMVQPSRLDAHYYRMLMSHYLNQLPSPLHDYCGQLILGEAAQECDQDFQQSMRRLGIIHLFCISGLHVSAIVTGIRLFLIYCRLSRESSEWLIILLLPIYAIIAGESIGLIRAVLMTEASLLGRKVYSVSGLDAWAISLLGGLMINPWLLLGLGGQLSYLLSLGLQVFAPQWSHFRQSLALNLLGLPSILSFLYEVHWLTFVASFVMIPVFTYFIFPAVIISALTYRILPGISILTNQLLLVLQEILVEISSVPGMISFGKPPLFVAMVLFLLTCLTINRQWGIRYRHLVLAYSTVFMAIHYFPVGEVTFVDIGQGDSIIIRTPFNRRVLVMDTGGKLQFQQARWAKNREASNLAERTSIAYLKSKGIKQINAIYLSHHDVDHIGYLTSFLTHFKVDEIVVPAGMEKQAAVQRLVAVAPCRPAVRPIVAGQVEPAGLTAVHPFSPGQGNNEDSLVLWGMLGPLRFIFSGDLGQQGELAVLKKYPCLQADVVKLGHHGSKTSSNPDYLSSLHPQLAIISAGRHNRYGHPNQDTLQTLHQLNIRSLSTQQYGMISYHYWGTHYYWKTMLKGDELLWTLKPSKNN